MKQENKTVTSFYYSIIKPYKWWYLLMLQAPFFNALFPLIYNYAIKLLIDLFTQNDQITFDLALWPVLLFLLANILLETCWRIHNLASWRCIPNITEDLLNKTYNYVTNHSYSFFQNSLTGTIISKIKGINDYFHKIHNALEYHVSKPALTALFTGIGLMITSPKIFLITLIFVVMMGILSTFYVKKLNKIENDKENSWHKIIGIISDNITNISTIFSYGTKDKESLAIARQFKKTHKPLMLKWCKVDFIMAILLTLVYWSFMAGLLFYLIHLKNIGEITVGDIAFTLFITYIFTDHVWQSINSIKTFAQDIAAFRSSFSIMQVPQENIDKENAKKLNVKQGQITFKNISFSYDKSAIGTIKNINLTIKAGQKVGIVGRSGAGKSTLIALLLKNFKATSGDIIIDNQSIYNTTSNSLHSQIALIPQDTMLFHRSIAKNIGYAKRNATKAQIKEAAKMANIDKFIETLPKKYDTYVGERGIKLSGGQRQRISIARAMLKNSPILVLDEATSSLDSQTEKEIQQSMSRMLRKSNTTIIAIAHRLSTIKNMDKIIVMDKGLIKEEGNFEELINKENGHFKKLWNQQIGEKI